MDGMGSEKSQRTDPHMCAHIYFLLQLELAYLHNGCCHNLPQDLGTTPPRDCMVLLEDNAPVAKWYTYHFSRLPPY